SGRGVCLDAVPRPELAGGYAWCIVLGVRRGGRLTRPPRDLAAVGGVDAPHVVLVRTVERGTARISLRAAHARSGAHSVGWAARDVSAHRRAARRLAHRLRPRPSPLFSRVRG